MCLTTFIISELPKTQRNSLKINDIAVHFFRHIGEITQRWATPQYFDLFLSTEYLQSVENAPPLGVGFSYVIFEKNKQIVGFIACQIKPFDAAASFNFEAVDNSIFPKFKTAFQKFVARHTAFNTLVVGNLMLTGDHAFWFDNQEIVSKNETIRLLTEGLGLAKKSLAADGIKIGATLFKEFYQDSENHKILQSLKPAQFHEFQVEPNFIMDLPPQWTIFDSYLEALSSKSRTRARRAFKKFGDIERKEFNEERIVANQLKINDLYHQICDRAGFNLVTLPPQYFADMKASLGDRFRLFGYFSEGRLVGFFTTIQNGDELEAHFLGYELALNAPYQLYLNMLFDIIGVGIERRVQRIVFARTAHEIKSSIGAQAVEMSLFLRHDNRFVNAFLPIVLRILSPRQKWLPRSPFK